MIDTIFRNDWLKKVTLTSEEECVVNENMSKTDSDDSSIQQFLDMLYGNTSAYNVVCDECASNLIHKLFDKYVSEKTLVIVSNEEHDIVKECCQGCKGTVLEVDYENIIKYNKLEDVIKDYNISEYDNAFVYIIGTHITNGVITPQSAYKSIKEYFVKKQVPITMVIDDCQGMFFVPRDYSIFDYVIYTAHTLIMDFNMGIMLDINNKRDIANGVVGRFNSYMKILPIYLKRLPYLMQFRSLMVDWFSDNIRNKNYNIFTADNILPSIFAIKENRKLIKDPIKKSLKPYCVHVDGIDAPYTYLRFRAQEVIARPVEFMQGLEKVEQLLKILK